MRLAIMVLCLLLASCGIINKKGRGTPVDPNNPSPELFPGHKQL